MSCEIGETYYTLQIPTNYQPLPVIPDRSYEEWVELILLDPQLRLELATKILRSLERLPELIEGQTCISSYSGGKDSQAIFMLSHMKYGPDRIFGLFADTHDEWPETYASIQRFEEWMQVPIHVADSMGIHTLLREHIPIWPKKNMRHCTKNVKLLPQRDWLDHHGYNQERKRGVPAFRSGTPYDVLSPAPLMLAGERWYESKSRSALPFDERQQELLRMTHRPVLDWRIEDVWDFIFWMKAPYNPVYTFGIKRVACSGCIFADMEELSLLGEYYPRLLEEWHITEQVIGVPCPYGSRSRVYEHLQMTNRLGCRQPDFTPTSSTDEFIISSDLRASHGQLSMNLF